MARVVETIGVGRRVLFFSLKATPKHWLLVYCLSSFFQAQLAPTQFGALLFVKGVLVLILVDDVLVSCGRREKAEREKKKGNEVERGEKKNGEKTGSEKKERDSKKKSRRGKG